MWVRKLADSSLPSPNMSSFTSHLGGGFASRQPERRSREPANWSNYQPPLLLPRPLLWLPAWCDSEWNHYSRFYPAQQLWGPHPASTTNAIGTGNGRTAKGCDGRDLHSVCWVPGQPDQRRLANRREADGSVELGVLDGNGATSAADLRAVACSDSGVACGQVHTNPAIVVRIPNGPKAALLHLRLSISSII